MLTISNVFVKYGDRVLMDHINLTIANGDKIGLVGRNGAGKSTFLKIISKNHRPDEGTIVWPAGASLAFLHQEIELPKGRTVLEEAMKAFEELEKLHERIETLNQELAERTDYESDSYLKLIEELGTCSERYQLMGGMSVEGQAERVLKGLGFKQKDFNRLTDEFSGGWQMRVELAKMLLQKPDYLLLDEPTNHLDIESIIWLESFLKDYTGSVIVISHDKQFLNNVTKRTVEIELGKVHDYKANYSKYLELRLERKEKQLAAFENQQRVIADKERTINRFMAKATKTKMAQSMQKQLDKIERIEIAEEDTATMNLRFPPSPRSGLVVMEAHNVVKHYGELKVLNGVDFKIERGEKVAFVGQNGQGKTTLAKILTGHIKATSGESTLGHNVQIGYYAQNQSDTLPTRITLLETMEEYSPPEMRTRLRAILGAFMFSGEDVEKKVSVLSGGERARLALACMLLRPFNLLVLDEPTNHLDILSKEVLKKALSDYDGTMIVVSHDRDFLSGLTTKTIEFRDGQLHTYLGDINYFLQKRAVSDMREVEKSSILTSTTPKRELNFDDRKRLQRQVQLAEKAIEKLETDIQAVETKMADPTFYNDPKAGEWMQRYEKMKKELGKAYEEWEVAQAELEAAV